MSTRKRIVQLCTILFAPLLILSLLAKPSFATAVVTPTSVYDDFEEILLKPDTDAYWWILNWGDDQRVEGSCGDASCILEGADGSGIDFADLVLYPDTTPGYYTNAEIAELPSGYAYGQEAKWKPTLCKDVVLEARVRWVGDFHQNGSGDAIGTSGIWLWNSPPDLPNNTFQPTKAMGFSWNTDAAAFAKGLAGTVVRQTIPVGIRKPLFNVNMNEWVDLKMVWDQNLVTQDVSFWINDRYIGTEILQIPFTEALSVEIWHDNQAYGLFGVTYESPPEAQNFQVDYIDVYMD